MDNNLHQKMSSLVDTHLAALQAKPLRVDRDKKADSKANQKALLMAVERCNSKQVESLLALGMDPNFLVERTNGWVMPLDSAIKSGNEGIVEVLLGAGASYGAIWSEWVSASFVQWKKCNQSHKDEALTQQEALFDMIKKSGLLLFMQGTSKLGSAVSSDVLKTLPPAFWDHIASLLVQEEPLSIPINVVGAFHFLPLHQKQLKQSEASASYCQQLLEQYLNLILEGITEHKNSSPETLNTQQAIMLENNKKQVVGFWKTLRTEQLEQIVNTQKEWLRLSEEVAGSDSSKGSPKGLMGHEGILSKKVKILNGLWSMVLQCDDLLMMKQLLDPAFYEHQGVANENLLDCLHQIPLHVSVHYDQNWQPQHYHLPSVFIKTEEDRAFSKTYKRALWSGEAKVQKVPLLTYALMVGAQKCAKVLLDSPVHKKALEMCPKSATFLTYKTPVESLCLLKSVGFDMARLKDEKSGNTPMHYYCVQSANKALLSQVLRLHTDWLGAKNREGKTPVDVIANHVDKAPLVSALEQALLKKQMPARSVKKASPMRRL